MTEAKLTYKTRDGNKMIEFLSKSLPLTDIYPQCYYDAKKFAYTGKAGKKDKNQKNGVYIRVAEIAEICIQESGSYTPEKNTEHQIDLDESWEYPIHEKNLNIKSESPSRKIVTYVSALNPTEKYLIISSSINNENKRMISPARLYLQDIRSYKTLEKIAKELTKERVNL
jgi:hypothetical protein